MSEFLYVQMIRHPNSTASSPPLRNIKNSRICHKNTMILLSHKAHTHSHQSLSPLINICILPDTTRLENGAAALTDDRQQVLLGLPIAFSYFRNCSKFRTSTPQVVYNIIYTHPAAPFKFWKGIITLTSVQPSAYTGHHNTWHSQNCNTHNLSVCCSDLLYFLS